MDFLLEVLEVGAVMVVAEEEDTLDLPHLPPSSLVVPNLTLLVPTVAVTVVDGVVTEVDGEIVKLFFFFFWITL